MSLLEPQPPLTPLERLLLEAAVGDHLTMGRIEKLCTAVERALVSGKAPDVDAGIVSWARARAALLEAAQRPEDGGEVDAEDGGSEDERATAHHIQHLLEAWDNVARTRILALAGILPEGRMR